MKLLVTEEQKLILYSVLEQRATHLTRYIQKPDANQKYVPEFKDNLEDIYNLLQQLDGFVQDEA